MKRTLARTTVITLLAVLTIAGQLTHVSDVLMFWGVLWAGLVCATVSLWAALYRRPRGSKEGGDFSMTR